MSAAPLAAEPEPSGEPPAAQYQSLYRRYRPQRFAEVRGQDLTTTTLRNAVRDGRIVHAYLFSGPRGTGKTTTARILAKALNCLQPEEGEPCGRCESCLDILRGASLDVHELDAASNNGVDAMRDLVSRAALATPGKRKVYIIDEVHMLSAAASNALLKTLEEPPEHVVFVLATTDPQRVLPTIRSRTQHFEFHLLETPVLEELLGDVARDAGLELPEDGIESAVRRGHGSARDALSVLDQVAASGIVEDDGHFLLRLIEAMVEQDPAAALRSVGEAAMAGFDAQRLAVELIEALREQFLASVARHVARPDSEVLGEDGLPLLPPARCVRSLEVIGKAIVDMRDSLDPRTTLEVAMVRLTSPAVDDSTAALLDRVERLERRLAELAAAEVPRPAPPPPQPAPARQDPGERPSLGAFRKQGPAPSPEATPAAPAPVSPEPAAGSTASPPAPSAALSRDDLVTSWGDVILPSLKPRAKAIYQVGRWLSVEDGTAVFALPNAAHVEHARPLLPEVSAAIGSHFRSALRLELATDASLAPPRDETEAALNPAGPPEEDEEAPSPHPERGATVVEGDATVPQDSASWAEHRLKEAFPGAEEVG